jgi:superfamily II DNA or RNA helicase
MLRGLELHPVYDSAEHDLVQDLIAPLLGESHEYWRGVGFFTSGWLRMACKGIVKLVRNGGTAHIVTSPMMQKADWEALQMGDSAKRDSVLRDILREHVRDLARALSQDTLNALAWMVADDVLEFKFAIARDFCMGGDYHDKVGVFIDATEDVVAIHGSFNDSVKGSLNGEAFSVFKSWEEGQRPFVEQHRTRLMKLWSDGNAHFQVLPLPDAIRQELVHLRTTVRPWAYAVEKGKSENALSLLDVCQSDFALRPYQRKAIDSWKQRNFKGIFEMATGTGKTYTALAAASERRAVLKQVAVLILVPYLHLLEQWRQNCEKFGFLPILCSGNHNQWSVEVRSRIQDYRLGVLPSICIVAVHHTAATQRFVRAVQGLPSESTVLIADEAHSLGAPRLRDALLPLASMRIGLSATPRRWYDPEGTQTLLDYFAGICFEYPLDQAIGTYLTPYRYIPILTLLTANESEDYEDLSRRIATLACRGLDRDVDAEEHLKRLLLQRAQIVSGAERKVPLLLEALQALIAERKLAGTVLRDVLIYCAPGKHREVLGAVSALGLRCHEFVHTVSMSQREAVLRQFAGGDIQVLIAIHCLDEGVDIPSTQTAFFLAGTTNPKEFIQRRGRLLRKCEGKVRADVYDFVVVPDINYAHLRRDSDLGMLRREMPRFSEFAAGAENEFEARAVIWKIVNAFQVLHLFDIKPWDIYHEVMESVEVKDRS